MRNNILISTTSSIENAEIERYMDLVSTNLVVGTNFFAGLRDALKKEDGYSDIYQGKLHSIYKAAVDKIRVRAAGIGANAVVGLKIDFNEITCREKPMFMITAMGMAVQIKYKNEVEINDFPDSISIEDFEKEICRLEIKKLVASRELPDNDQWVYLLNNPIDEIIPDLLGFYLEYVNITKTPLNEKQKLLMANFLVYLKIANGDAVVKALYAKITSQFKEVHNIIETGNFFSPMNVLDLINIGCIREAINCLSANKEVYTQDDLQQMVRILDALDNLPDKGKIEMVKGLLSKGKEKYICPCGHSNDVGVTYCESYDCGLNIKGLVESQVKAIEVYREKVNLLSSLLVKR